MNIEQTRHAWRIAGTSIALSLLLILVLYQQTVLYLVGLWNNLEVGEYGHGYLVLAISAYLIVRNRRRLAALTPCPTYWGLPAVMAASLIWLVAVLVDVNMMQAVALLLLVLAVTWTLVGNKAGLALMFPILFIGFAIPVWFPLSPLLQDLTADVVFWLIRMLEVPAFREQNMIVVPAGRLSIEEACSGLRYLLAALTLGTLYAYLNYRTLRARLVVVLVAAAAAVLANFIRVFIVVYLGYATDMQHPYVHDHLMLGWYLFGGLVAVLLVIDARLYKRSQQAGDSSGLAQKVQSDSEPAVCTAGKFSYLAIVAIAVVLVSLGPAAAYRVNNQPQSGMTSADIRLPVGSGVWEGPLSSDDDWRPVYHGAIDRTRIYANANDKVIVYAGYYPFQKQGEELINDLNSITNKEVWKAYYPRARLKQVGEQQVLEQLLKKSSSEQRLVWYWYTLAGQSTTSKYAAKLLQLLGLLTGDQRAWVIAVAVDHHGDGKHAREVLHDFVSTMAKPLDEDIARSR